MVPFGTGFWSSKAFPPAILPSTVVRSTQNANAESAITDQGRGAVCSCDAAALSLPLPLRPSAALVPFLLIQVVQVAKSRQINLMVYIKLLTGMNS